MLVGEWKPHWFSKANGPDSSSRSMGDVKLAKHGKNIHVRSELWKTETSEHIIFPHMTYEALRAKLLREGSKV